MAQFHIQNDWLRVSINQKGAELASIQSVETQQEYLWEADKNYWGRHSAILFPIVGRLKANEYFIDDQRYELTQHGFARNLSFELLAQEATTIIFQLTDSPESRLKYPFQFELQAKYQLEKNSLSITYQVKNTDSKTIYFSIGAHPAFRCPLTAEEQRSDYYLEFEQRETLFRQLLKEGLRTGEQQLVLDDAQRISITDTLFEEDALIFKNLKSNHVHLVNGKKEQILTFDFTDFPYLGIWSAQGNPNFVCLEPWFGVADKKTANGNFKEKEGVISLESGKTFECTHRVTVHL